MKMWWDSLNFIVIAMQFSPSRVQVQCICMYFNYEWYRDGNLLPQDDTICISICRLRYDTLTIHIKHLIIQCDMIYLPTAIQSCCNNRGGYWQEPHDTIRMTILRSRWDIYHDIVIQIKMKTQSPVYVHQTILIRGQIESKLFHSKPLKASPFY